MKSVMKHRFSEVANVDIPRSRFKRNHGYKTTFDAGYLIPIFYDLAYPGDTFNVNCHGFARLSTPLYPIMDNLMMDTFWFAVPMRLLWENFQKFMGERIDPGDSIDYTLPVIASDAAGYDNETLYDYLGLPTKVTASYEHNAHFPRAYYKIWNDWFRDQNLQDSLPLDIDDGPDLHTDFELQRRGKRHDYFTSCLTDLQKGDAVLVPLGESAPVTGFGAASQSYSTGPANAYETDGSGSVAYADYKGGDVMRVEEDPDNPGFPNVRVNLADSIGPSVNLLRQSIQVQRMLEKDMRAGTRYTEIIESYFGVTSSDARLQRAEYLGGGSTPVNINPVARTDSSPGTLGAFGVASFGNHGFVKSFTEHCVVMGLLNVRADLTYQEGLDRLMSDQTRLDMYWPTLAHLGEMAVLNKEIYIDATTIGNGVSEEVFGYQERFAHLRYKSSKITGKLRSNDAGSLEAWHLGIEFGSTPTLDDTFIEDNPPIDRVIATPTEPHFIFDSYIEFDCVRPMPTYSIPGYIDHF